MALTMKERKAVTKELAVRYRRATKSEKGRLLDEFTGAITGYHRGHAARALRRALKPKAAKRWTGAAKESTARPSIRP